MADLERRRGYHPNHSMEDGLGGFMMDPRKTGKVALQAARQVARRAKMLVEAEAGKRPQARGADGRYVPVDEDGKSLADSFEVDQTIVVLNENPPNPRLAAIVVNQKRYAARWEFGAAPGHRNAHRSLRRAGASVGQLRGEIG